MTKITDPIAQIRNGKKIFIDRFARLIYVEAMGLSSLRVNILKPVRGWDKEIVSFARFMEFFHETV